MKNIHGGDIYQYENILDFSANINPLGAPESVKAAIADAIEQIGCYPEMYSDSLRKAIGEKYGVDSSQIICGNGAADVIYRYVYAVRPKKILVTAPCFAEYEGAFRSLCADDVNEKAGEKMALTDGKLKDTEKNPGMVGPEVVVYHLNHGDFCIRKDILTMLEREKPDIVFLCNPNNPTGALIQGQLLEAIAAVCRTNKIRLFLDECFLDFTGQEEVLSLAGKLQEYQGLFILKAFTKMYAMAGVRLGFGLTADTELIERMYQSGPPWNVSVLAGAAGKAAIKEEMFVKETIDYIKREKEYLYHALEKLSVQYWKSAANYILLKSDQDLKERLIKEGILIRDCSNYRNLSEGYFRIAVKSHGDNERLAAALARVLEKSISPTGGHLY